MKKYIIIAVVLVIVTGIVAGYFYFNKPEKVLTSTINAIPTDATLILEVSNLDEFSSQINTNCDYWNALSTVGTFKELKSQLIYLDSTFNKFDDLRNNYLKRSVLVSAHPSGKNDIDFLFVVQNKLNADIELIKKVFGLKTSDINISDYDNTKIYTLKNIDKISFAYLSGVVIFSKSKMLLEKSIRHINAGVSILDNPIYKQIALTAGANVDANVYVNVNELSKLLKPIISEELAKKITNNTSFTDQTELDFYIKKDEVLLNGFSFISDSLNNYMNIFKGQKPISFEIEEILPANTSMFLLYGISDKTKFKNNYNRYLEKSKKLEAYNKGVKLINNKYNFDISKEFYSFLDNEICIFYTDINKLNYHQNAFVAFRTLSKSMAKDKLGELLNSYAGVAGMETSSLETIYSVDEETSFTIYHLPLNIPKTLFGNVFENISAEYYTYIDNYLVFGNSIKALSNLIYDNVLHKTLENNMQYNKTKDRVSSRVNFNLYINIPAFKDLGTTFFNAEFQQTIEENKELVNKFQSFIYQSEIEGDLLYNTMYLKYNPVFKDKPRTVWESKIDAALAFKPKVVINHRNSKNEIFVQDIKNNIYLINDAGRVLWKKNIGERIISKIYQVDAFKNKKLQYLFNTKSKMYLVDRNGNFVERYPVTINNGASCGLAVFDYDNSRDYRVLITDVTKNAKLYNLEGSVIEGWEFAQSDNIVRTTPQHFRIDDKDYIVFSDSLKTYILDRRGNSRIDIKEYFVKSNNNNFVLDRKSDLHKDRLITTDNKGQIKFIYFDGEVKTFAFDKYSSEHFFLYKDIDADGRNDYIFADGSKIIAYNYKKKVVFEYSFDENISEKPSYYQFPGNIKKVGVVLKKNNKIYLINSDASLHQGFPLKGQTGFSIARFEGLNAEFNLIVGADNEFIFNYKVK